MGRNGAKHRRRLTSKPARPEPSHANRLKVYIRRNLGIVLSAVGAVTALIWQVLHWLGYIHTHHFRR